MRLVLILTATLRLYALDFTFSPDAIHQGETLHLHARPDATQARGNPLAR